MKGQNQSNQDALSFLSFKRLGGTLGLAICLLFPPVLAAQLNAEGSPVAAATAPLATGPEVGQKIPSFRAPDQHGKAQDFNSIRGPKGAMIVFFRSADW
jgi:hypothetical protein